MARRRSLNRRSSRKSLNVTELDQNSDLINSHDQLWYKLIEGDMTAYRSRLSFYGEMTEPILNDDSVVSTSGVKSDWWKHLDKTATLSPRRTSTRKSVQITEPPSHSSHSESSDHGGIKKRRVALRARDKKDAGTENFLAALQDSNSLADEKEKSMNRSEETQVTSHRRNRQNQGKNVGESEADTSVNTSNDTDVILKSRPKPFKKRFTKITDDTYGNAASSEQRSIDETIVDSSPVGKSPEKNINVRDSQLMGPPQSTSQRKRLSSVSRKLDISSEESESDGKSKKKRFGAGMKSRKSGSINPFDRVIEEHLEAQKVQRKELETGNEESLQQDSRDPGSVAATNRSVTSGLRKQSTNQSIAKSLVGESSQSQQIDDASDNDDEEKHEERGENLQKRTVRSSRSVRSSKRLIDESAYELPPPERSPTPLISDSEKEAEKSFSPEPRSGRTSRMSLRSNRSATQNTRSSVEPLNSSKSRTTAHKIRENSSRTRIFSDEDISLENISNTGRNENLIAQDQHQSSKAKKSFGANRSLRIIQPDESTVENKASEESITKSTHPRPEDLRKSPVRHSRSITKTIFIKKNQQQAKYDKSPIGSEPDNIDQSISSNLQKFEKSTGQRSRTSTIHENIIATEEIEDEDTAEDVEISVNSRSQAEDNTRKSRKSVPRKSQTSTRNERSSRPEESEEEAEISQEVTPDLPDKSTISRKKVTNKSQEKTNDRSEVVDESISSNVPSSENLRRSRKTVAYKSRTNDQNEGSSQREESESDEEFSQRTKSSGLHEKSTHRLNSSRSQSKNNSGTSRIRASTNRSQQIESLENAHEDEQPQAATETDPRPSGSQLREKTRNSRKSFASRKHNYSDDNSSTDENAKGAHRKSGVGRKSVTFGKNLSRNKSRTIVSNVDTSEEEDTEPNNENPRASQAIDQLHDSRKRIRSRNESRNRVLSDENNSGEETEVAEKATSVAHNSSSIDRSQENAQSDDNASEDEGENVRNSDPNDHRKSRTSEQSFSLVQSPKRSQKLAKIVESEEEGSKKLAKASKTKSFARGNTNQRNFDSDEIVDENNENYEDNGEPLAGKKSTNDARSSGDVLATPKPKKDSRGSLFMKKRNVKDASTLDSSSFTPLAARIPRTHHSTPLHAQKSIKDFFESRSQLKAPRVVSSSFDAEKFEKVKKELEEMKKKELEKMKLEAEARRKKEDDLKKRLADAAKLKKKTTAASAKKVKVVDKAFIVNGAVYKQPRLPRPKPWVTDRLYRHLWKLMEPKYRISTRIKSEEFIKDLAKAVTFITKRVKYDNYKHELKSLMLNMARLGIIKTRNDFYDFCYDFLPYDFRVKVTPIMMPGNVLTIPYDPIKLHTPLIREDHESSKKSLT